jgi:hypothetical protein
VVYIYIYILYFESRDLRATSKTLSTKTHGQGNCQSTGKVNGVPMYGGGWFCIGKSGGVWWCGGVTLGKQKCLRVGWRLRRGVSTCNGSEN